MNKELEEREKLVDLLGKGDNIFNARYIIDNWIHVKWHTEFNFWNCMIERMPLNFEIVEEYLFKSEHLDSSIHGKRNRVTDYGIALKLFQDRGEDVCLFIERGEGSISYGVIIDHEVVEGRNWINNHKNLLDHLKTFNFYHNEIFENNYWLAWNYPKRDIDFENFNNTDTLQLTNNDKRIIIVDELWCEIKGYTDQVMNYQKSGS